MRRTLPFPCISRNRIVFVFFIDTKVEVRREGFRYTLLTRTILNTIIITVLLLLLVLVLLLPLLFLLLRRRKNKSVNKYRSDTNESNKK